MIASNGKVAAQSYDSALWGCSMAGIGDSSTRDFIQDA